MTQRWNGAGLESVNGSVLSRREKDRLVGPHIKTTKGTHTHTHPRPPPRSDRPWYLWEILLSFLFLGGTNHTKEKSQEQNLHLVSHGPSSVKADCVPVAGEDGNRATFYGIVMLVWRVMNQWLFLLSPRLHRSHLPYPVWQGSPVTSVYYLYHEGCFKRSLRGSGHVTFRGSEISQCSLMFQGQEYLFTFVSWDKAGISCPRYISPTPLLFP